MHTLHRVSAFAFYLLGSCVIVGVVLIARGVSTGVVSTILHTLDLPLLVSGMLYGGSSLILSLKRDRISPGLTIVVFGFLGILFLGFAILNFYFPFPEIF